MHLVYNMTEIAAFILVPFFLFMMAQSLLLRVILETGTKVKVAKFESMFLISSPHCHNMNEKLQVINLLLRILGSCCDHETKTKTRFQIQR